MKSTASPKEDHWTYKLFVEHPELYIPVLELGKEKALVDTEGLCKIFAEFSVPEGSKILDLACGIGRHSIPLAKRGYEVVGYDLSPVCLKRARKWSRKEGLNKGRIRFYEGDMRDVSRILTSKGERNFNVIINMETSLGYYGEEEDIRILRNLHKLASPNCVLVIDIVHRDYLVRTFQPHGIKDLAEHIEWHGVRRLNLETSFMENRWRYYEKRKDGGLELVLDLKVDHRLYNLHELKEIMNSASWNYRGAYGNIQTLEPVSYDSPRMVVVGRKS